MRRTFLLFGILLLSISEAWAQHVVTGLVLKTDPAHKEIVVSCESVPDVMEAMVMSFSVRDEKVFSSIAPGETIEFTMVLDGDTSYADHILLKQFQSTEQEPMEARRLRIVQGLVNPSSMEGTLSIGQAVPEFSFTDQSDKPISFSQLSGKVVAIAFIYSRCPNPNYCFKLSNNFGRIQKRFSSRMGRDLVLLSILVDSEHDQGSTLIKYADIWKADPNGWHFLTGPLPDIKRVAHMFGMDFWLGEGFLTHSFHTVVIDRQGKLAANLEGNTFTTQELGDLVETIINKTN